MDWGFRFRAFWSLALGYGPSFGDGSWSVLSWASFAGPRLRVSRAFCFLLYHGRGTIGELSASSLLYFFFGGTTFVAALLVEDDDGIVFGLGF